MRCGAFVRDETLRPSATTRTWSDSGNTTIRITTGWEVTLRTPQGEKFRCRMYAQVYGYDDQPQVVTRFLRTLDVTSGAR